VSGKRVVHGFVLLATVYVLASVAGGMWLAEMSLHTARRPIHYRDKIRVLVAAQFHAELQDVEVQSQGAKLSAWYIKPQRDNGLAVVLLHGVTDNREGVSGYAQMFLAHGYRVLLPDARAHGESGGAIATYGVLERYDTRDWVEWLYGQGASCVYGFGESMGAALIVQAEAVEPRLCGVVAESTFSTFREVAYDRFAQHGHVPLWLARLGASLPVEAGLIWTRWRYAVDLGEANPAEALSQSKVPTLLIHGTRDMNIRARHSIAMAKANPSHTELWLVNADHGGAVGIGPREFEAKAIQHCSPMQN
jgi:pimeloyl-ACP methyl ester carboxylesterase